MGVFDNKPLPRYRLYTNLEKYIQFSKDIFFIKSNLGDDLKKFENQIKLITGAPFAIAMPQNRVGTYLALKALIRPNSKVIMSPYTIHDVVNMVICAGGIPVFVDIERKTCNLDLKLVEDYIEKDRNFTVIFNTVKLLDNLYSLLKEHDIKFIVWSGTQDWFSITDKKYFTKLFYNGKSVDSFEEARKQFDEDSSLPVTDNQMYSPPGMYTFGDGHPSYEFQKVICDSVVKKYRKELE